jgi:hypothetical protein
VHRITDIIEKTLENKGVCSAVFLDVAQAFDRVWHKGLQDLSKEYFNMCDVISLSMTISLLNQTPFTGCSSSSTCTNYVVLPIPTQN